MTVAHLLTGLVALLSLFWVINGARLLLGMRNLPRLAPDDPTPPDASFPTLSVILAARDEAERIEAAVKSLLEQDYARFEVIAVNDRSRDDTGDRLRALASRSPRDGRGYPLLRLIEVTELPNGWLGKTHALWLGSRMATGEWLLFTDADVHFERGALRRAMTFAIARGADHLVVLPKMELRGFWEKSFYCYLALLFLSRFRPWRVREPKSRTFVGVGAFNLIRRSAYEAVGTHQALKLDVIDDMKLGKLVKRHGGKQEAVGGNGLIRVRWQVGLKGMIRGLEKNAFAGADYRLWMVLLAIPMLPLISVVPFLSLLFPIGWWRLLALPTWAMIALPYYAFGRGHDIHWWHFLSHPVAALLFLYAFVRSAYVILRRGGVEWRGTFYPLDELRRNLV